MSANTNTNAKATRVIEHNERYVKLVHVVGVVEGEVN